jgi:hypothetical protein
MRTTLSGGRGGELPTVQQQRGDEDRQAAQGELILSFNLGLCQLTGLSLAIH